MIHDVIMPKTGMAMEEGSVVQWLKKEGEKVEKGEPLLEIETDKVTMEVEAEFSGTLLKILAGEGETVPVTQTIAYVGEEGDTIPEGPSRSAAEASADTAAASDAGDAPSSVETEGEDAVPGRGTGGPAGTKVPSTPKAKRLSKEKGIDLGKVMPSGKHGEVLARDVEAAEPVKVSPVARKFAEQHNLDLTRVAGTGPGGRIVKEDVKKSTGGERRKPLTGVRKKTADRMTVSHQTIPPVTLTTKADVTLLVTLREDLRDHRGVRISYNDFIILASARAIREYPAVNSAIEGDEIVGKENINIGLAVAAEDLLYVPVIRNADELTLLEIAERSADIVKRTREKKLVPDDLSGVSFTVSNLGMFDIGSFNPIIGPGQSAILGVGSIEPELRRKGNGDIEDRLFMGLSLTVDHRFIDGALGAKFLKFIKDRLEHPAGLFV